LSDDGVLKYGRYVLVRMLLPDDRRLFGEYDVKRVGGDSDTVLDDRRHEVVEFGENASAAEWMRLAGVKDDLVRALEVMES
jgi:hypothetical protein